MDGLATLEPRRVKLPIEGMTCASCVVRVEKTLAEGRRVEVDRDGVRIDGAPGPGGSSSATR